MEPGSSLRRQLGTAYAAVLPDFFDRPAPLERRATCEACAMCVPAGETPALGARAAFEPDAKCCTYHPSLPAFAAGALLADSAPEWDEGRRRLRQRIARQHGVSPRGVDGPPAYWLRYGAAPSAFGRARDLLCPYFDEGRCTVWSFREAVCATYYCKHEQGADGLAFWQAVRQYLAELGEALVTHALLELGFGPEQSLERPAADLTPEELDGLPLPAAEYGARWGRWAGREEDCFREAHRVVAALGPDGAAAVGGARLRARLAQVEAAGQALAAPRLPQRLRRNPQLKVFRDGPAYVLEGYSPLDPSRVGGAVHGLLDAFDGRPRAEVVQELKAQGRPFPSEGLLRALHHHRVLVDAEPGEGGGITGSRAASSPVETGAQGRGER